MSTSNNILSNDQVRILAPSVFADTAHSRVSSRYSFLPTATVLDGLRGAGWVPVEAKEQRVRESGREGFQKHLLRFRREGDIASYAERKARVLSHAPSAHVIVSKEEAAITPELVLVNSHDRSSAYQLHAGVFRFVCANGLVIADSLIAKVSITHIDFDPAAVVSASLEIADRAPLIMDKVGEFQARRLSPVEQRAFAESAILMKYDDLDTAPVSAERVLEPNRHADAGEDLWRVFNRVQENLVRGGQKEYGRRVPGKNGAGKKRAPRTRAVDGIDNNLRLNKALWHMAEVLRQGGNPARD